jgi:DNA-binding NtrC family response regulator
MMTAYRTYESILESLRLGAVEFLLKPVTPSEVADAVTRSLAMRRGTDGISESPAPFTIDRGAGTGRLAKLMGPGPAVKEMEAFVRKVAPSTAPVLLSGETGTGKEIVARAIHDASPRGSREMVTVNCGAIPENLVEAELFGHERGSFTGAHESRAGLLEVANGSTMFLDEVGELPAGSQVKLLRALQEGSIRRIGSAQNMPVDIRIVAATNRDPEREIEKGNFRRDLYYRLSVLRLRVPPLRERREDVLHLVERFLTLYAPEDAESPRLSRRAMKALRRYPWPGNVRELENEIARVVTMAESESIELHDLSEEIRAAQEIRGAGSLKVALDMQERRMIIACLDQVEWNKTEAARLLGMSRQNLYQRLEYHEIPKRPAHQDRSM